MEKQEKGSLGRWGGVGKAWREKQHGALSRHKLLQAERSPQMV